MTPDDVRAAVDQLKRITDDPEEAHIQEDRIRSDVLSAIALGTATDPQAMAAIALETDDLEFPRWCA